MSHPVPRPPSAQDAARSDLPSMPAERPLPDFQPHDPRTPDSEIEREIERSQRASAALAAARALARASFTDSQLAAEDAAQGPGADFDNDIDTSGWTRTEYVPFDPAPQDDAARNLTPRNLVGGSFNPGIASQHARPFAGASIAHTPIRTRSGAHARFAQESRHAPRDGRAAGAVVKTEPLPSTAHYDKPAVIPMLAPPAAAPVVARVPAQSRARAGAGAGEPAKFVLAAVFGAAVVLIGGGIAWNAGLLSRSSPDNPALITPAVAAQAEAARVLSAEKDIPIAPAAGVEPQRSDAEVDAALAAAARAAAMPAASVRAAGPARGARPVPLVATPPAAAPAAVRRGAPQPRDSVDEAIANAQARADRFLATGSNGAASAATTQAKPGQ